MSRQQDRNSARPPATSPASDAPADGTIRVVHVDGDGPFVERTATWLEAEGDAIAVTTATGAAEGLDHLEEEPVDCVVSEYDVPGTDGLGFLRQVRERSPGLPFLLYTGRGSEEIASEAIAAGVTDYLRKESGAETDQYAVLVNRIEEVVSRYRAERAVEETREQFQRLVEHSADVVSILDADGRWEYLSPSAECVLGYEPEELIGEVGFDYVHPDDRPDAMETFARVTDSDHVSTVEFRFDHPSEGWIWLENRVRNLVDDPVVGGFVVHTRDVTDRKRSQQELTRRTERLEEVVTTLAHDIRNPLDVAEGCLYLARETGDEDHFERIERSHARMERIVEDAVTLTRDGKGVEQPQPVQFEGVVADAWQRVETSEATLACDGTETILADGDRCRRLFENLFRNSVEHSSTGSRPLADEDAVGVRVRAGTTGDGFYVADDGQGISPDEREQVFEPGYSTTGDGTGFGLSIVREIVVAHDWEIDVTESRRRGARFDITGVEFV